MSRTPTKEGLMKWVDDYAVAHDLGPREALFLSKFAAYADAAGEAWAAVKTLAERARSSERKIQYLLRAFEADGVIRRTGGLHRLPDSTRDVPIYAFVGYLDSLADPDPMGARRAPIEAHGCTDEGGMGAHTVHPHNEQIEQTPSDEGDAGAREGLFERLEEAYPKRGLGFTNRGRARIEFWKLLDGGVEAEALIAAAARYAADRTVKRADLGLDYWLADRKYRGWQAAGPVAGQVVAAANPSIAAPAAVIDAAGEADQRLWAGVLAHLKNTLEAGDYVSYASRLALAERSGQLFAVAWSGLARDWLSRRCWTLIEKHWAGADDRGRSLVLTSKSEFEAAAMRGQEV